MAQKNVVVAQSGGPTPVINSTLRGIVETCKSMPDHFGAVYAGLLLVLTVPSATNVVVESCYSQGMFLPMFVNPFVALACYMDAHFGSGRVVTAYWMIGATMAFSLGCAYLFRHISSARFAGLRRSQ